MKRRFSGILIFLLFLFVFNQFSCRKFERSRNFSFSGTVSFASQVNDNIQGFYVQKQADYSGLIKNIKIERKNKNFENNISRQFLSCTKSKSISSVYSSYENAHFMRLKCLSKFIKTVIKLQTFI